MAGKYVPPPEPLSLVQWINQALTGMGRLRADQTTPALCTALVLVHVNGQHEVEIHNVIIGGKKYDDTAVNNLTRTFESMAVTDAQHRTGKQQYEVKAVFEDQENKPARFMWKVSGHLINTAGDNSTEPPTQEGRTMQRMRHDETYSTMLVTTLANSINQQNHFVKMVMDHTTQLAAERNELSRHVQEMLVEKIRNDQEHEIKLLEMKQKSDLYKQIAKIAPALMNTITGRELVPQSTVDTAIVEMIAEHVGPDDMKHLMPILSKLPPEATGVLMTRLEAIQKEKNNGDERVERSLGRMSPAALAEAELGGDGNESAH